MAKALKCKPKIDLQPKKAPKKTERGITTGGISATTSTTISPKADTAPDITPVLSPSVATASMSPVYSGNGRPPRYPTHIEPRLREIYDWIREGKTEYSIADALGIAYQTWVDAKKTYPALMETLQKARAERTATVVDALYKRAVGYDAVEVEDGPKGTIVRRKHIPGDTTAQQVYLYNRDPDNWQAKRDPDSGRLQQNINIDNLQLNIMTSLEALESLKSLVAQRVEQLE